jgi:hypothetical protein
MAMLVVGCSGTGVTYDAASTGDAPAADESGYAIVGRDIYPPLRRRVRAAACSPQPSAECVVDADCGAGRACVCSQATVVSNVCVSAECKVDADCGNGLCLLGLGSLPSASCQSAGKLGLYCARGGSLCQDGGDCPGNGRACVYMPSSDRFECGAFSCL